MQTQKAARSTPSYAPNRLEMLETRRLMAADTTALDTGFFNDDLREDIVTLRRGGGQNGPRLIVLLSDPSGGFGAPITIPFKRAGSITAIASGDFDGDGENDLLISSNGKLEGTTGGVRNKRSRVHFLTGNGDGSFNKATPIVLGGVQEIRFISTARFDDDNNLDLVISSRAASNFTGPQQDDGLFVLLGNGDGTFQNAQQVDVDVA